MRIIRIINSNLGKAKNVETSAETWGELKSQSEVAEMIKGNVKAVVRENQTTLEADSATLPGKLTGEDKEYDFSVFIVTKESKAGGSYENLGFHELRRKVSERGGNNNGKTRGELIEYLRSTDNGGGQTSPSVNDPVISRLDSIESKVDSVLDFLEVTYRAEVPVTSDSEITDEEAEAFRSIKAQL